MGRIPLASIFCPETSVHRLLNRLSHSGVGINPVDCEQRVRYILLGESKESVIPLPINVSDHARVEGFVLRNGTLRIDLSNYLGARNSEEYGLGVRYKVLFDGRDAERDHFDISVRTLRDFYNPMNLFGNPIGTVLSNPPRSQ